MDPRAACGAAVLALAACGSSGGGGGAARARAGLGTIDTGKLKVAVEPYMPYTAIQGGKIVGLDGDILNAVGRQARPEGRAAVTDFNGMLGGVQSHRVDITHRRRRVDRRSAQKQGLFTDPPYYSPPAMAVRAGKTYSTVEDLQGQRLGTVTGYVWVKSIKADPGRQAARLPGRQRRLQRPRRRPARRRLPRPAADHRDAEGSART